MIENRFYKNGQIKKEVEYIDNVKNGRVRWYYPNGELKGTGFYNDGRCDGDFITYYRSGKIKSRVKYKDGEPISLIEYFEDEPKKKAVIPEKKVERKVKTKNSNTKKFLIISLILVSGFIYTLSNLLNGDKKETAKLQENKAIEEKSEKKVETAQEVKEATNVVVTEKKEEKIEKIKPVEIESVVLEEDAVELSRKDIKKDSVEKIESSETLSDIPKELLTPEKELEIEKTREEETKVQEINRQENTLTTQVKGEEKETKSEVTASPIAKLQEIQKQTKLKEEENSLTTQVKEEEIKSKATVSPITKLQELQKQTKLNEEGNSPVKTQKKKVVNQKKSQILQEIKTDEVNINYVSRVTTEEREAILKGIKRPKYNVYEDERYGYRFVYPYNIVDLSNFQTKYLRGKSFSAKGGYLLGKLIVISSNELKELKAYSIQQLFENELRSKYAIIEKNLNVEDGNYEMKFQMNNKYLERYVMSSKNGDYYLFLTMEYNQVLDKDLKKIIKKMKKELKAN